VIGKKKRAAHVKKNEFDRHRLRLLRQTLLSMTREVEVDCWSNE
jgi:hypothetical protein